MTTHRLLELPEMADIWFSPGTEIMGRYTISSLLGHGGVGAVYLAYDQVLNKAVALKFIRNSLFAEQRSRIEAEVALAQQVTHVNVCRVHDLNIEHRPAYLSMEYIDGEDLERTLQRVGRIVPDRALQIASDICAGLCAAHDKGVIHRDLKPQNVMVDSAGIARLTDFGLGRLSAIRESGGVIAGTPFYMSPEQANGQAATEQSDLFSLGVVLYELYTGEFPISLDGGGSPLNWERSRIVPPSEIVPQIERNVEQTIIRCLEFAPEDRPSSAHAVLQGLTGERAASSGRTAVYNAPAGRIYPIRWLAAATIVGLVAGWLVSSGFRLVERIDFTKPSVADYKQAATQLIGELGYTVQNGPGTSDFGFDYDSSFVNDPSAPGQTISFWYRQCSQPLVPRRFTISREHSTAQIRFDDPPWTEPGMLGVRIAADGTLREFRAVPELLGRNDEVRTPTQKRLALLFSNAGMDIADFERGALEGIQTAASPVVAETRSYRSKSDPTAANVYVSIAGEDILWFSRTNDGLPKRDAKRAGNKINEAIYLLLMVCGIVGCFLARRNLALGRTDRRGAWRASVIIFVASLISWCFSASHLPLFEGEVQLAQFGFANALFWAGTLWLVYLSFEPFLRQEHARGMLSWNRAVNGQWRNPLVARDILVGCMFGTLLTPTLGTLHRALRTWIGAPERFEIPPLDLGTLEYPAYMVAMVANALMNGIYSAFILLLLPSVVSKALGNKWLGIAAAWLVFTVLFGLFYGSGITPWSDQVAWLAYMGVWAAAYLFVVQRFGLLATIAMVATLQMVFFTPSTLHWDRWYAATGAATYAAMAAVIIGYAAWVIMARRPQYQ
jgi:serine/threonine-protein kinase